MTVRHEHAQSNLLYTEKMQVDENDVFESMSCM